MKLPPRTSLVILLCGFAFLAAPYAPGGLPGATPALLLVAFTPRLPRTAPPPPPPEAPAPVIELPDFVAPPHSLDRIFTAWRSGRTARILHYGDSPTTADSITAGVRRTLQKRFGDAGHGFLLIAPPWAWYGHIGTELNASGWEIQPASQTRAKDHIHGLGGVNFEGGPGATSRVRLKVTHNTGRVYYLAQPNGGQFVLSSGETELATIHTDDPEKHIAAADFTFPDGADEVTLRVTEGQVRAFGYRFDRSQTGVQYSSLGINGASAQTILRGFDQKSWAESLRLEQPDLIVVNYGTNESTYENYVETDYRDELRKVISRLKEAAPGSSILIMSPMDRGVRNSSGDIETPATLVRVVEIQRAVAEETGCAFFNTFHAMGGEGTMGRWYAQTPQLVSGDFIHPMPKGADIVADKFSSALLRAFGEPQ